MAFIRTGLQNAASLSKDFRLVLVAAIRKSVRLLAVVEYSSEEGASEDDGPDGIPPVSGKRADSENAPDARLASFLTGILLSEPVRNELSEEENILLMSSLFESWCIGLLSASSPWRMVCALTAASILNLCPVALIRGTSRVRIVSNYIARLESTVARRVWAERAATPVCSRYLQGLVELFGSVKRALRLCKGVSPTSFTLKPIVVDAATPVPFSCSCIETRKSHSCESKSWEWSEGWVSSDAGWEIWTGSVEIMQVDWKTPSRSVVRTLMDGGEGPPLLKEDCLVLRGPDWDNRPDASDEDGKDMYEKEKAAKEKEKEDEEQNASSPQPEADSKGDEEKGQGDGEPVPDTDSPVVYDEPTPTGEEEKGDDTFNSPDGKKNKKKKKGTSVKLAIGTVLSIEPWKGMPGLARKVRWSKTGKEGIYRYGGDGGRHDISHVELNDKKTRIKKRHPVPETAEQCASRYGFGQRRVCNVLLRLRQDESEYLDGDEGEVRREGILEWPDFGAGIRVDCILHSDGAVTVTENDLVFGSKDSGWEARFGQPSFISGTTIVISPTKTLSESDPCVSYDMLLGSNSLLVKNLRNKEDGGSRLRVTSEMRLLRSKRGRPDDSSPKSEENTIIHPSSQPPPICFDSDCHAPSISLSKDKRTVTCTSSDGRGTAFANVGFTKGVHYWEVKLERAEVGSVFIGVAEKPSSPSGSSQGTSFGFESQASLNRWLGWGFVNFRATYTVGAERVFGAHCHAGDTVGVMLDCDAGRISYFFDGVKYGEHILNDLGCAFENVSPFGFNADGCGGGGGGQGAPSGIDGGRGGRYPSNGAVRPRALWPVIGLRHPRDQVTMSSKWMSSHGIEGVTALRNAIAVDEILCAYEGSSNSNLVPYVNAQEEKKEEKPVSLTLPKWFVEESYLEYQRWKSGRWLRSVTRGSGPYTLASFGLDCDLDTSPISCASACAAIGIPIALLSGDKVAIKRSAGRLLELQEEAVILGAHQGRLFYRISSQKSEGGSLMEGGGRAWFWDESEAVHGGLQLIGEGLGLSVELPKLAKFRSPGSLQVVFTGGAVVRSDLEIFDGSASIGTIPHGTVIPANKVLERRLNSVGVVRYLIEYEPIGKGWISSRIRGDKEEPIVLVQSSGADDADSTKHQFLTSEDSAREWYTHYKSALLKVKDRQVSEKKKKICTLLDVKDVLEYEILLTSGTIAGMSAHDSDSLVAATYGKIADVLPQGNALECPFFDCALAIMSCRGMGSLDVKSDPVAHEVAAESLSHVVDKLPSLKAILVRMSMLRALNRRALVALPWLSLRPAQEGSAILGGLFGFGASLERAGKTWDSKSMSSWVQASSMATRLRSSREILFANVKRAFFDSVINATTTPTPLSHDEYELPREVRTVRVNRLKARRAMASSDITVKRKHSVFSQLQRETRGWSGATLRRGFVAKGHGGQKRAFKVKLVGEGVNDYSGPYREVFTDAIQEVTRVDDVGNSSLGVLESSPNNSAEVGEERDLFVFASSTGGTSEADTETSRISFCNEEKMLLNSFSSLTFKKTEGSREVEDALVFLGKLVGTACRHGIPVDLPLPLGVAFKRLSEEVTNLDESLREIDLLAFRRLVGGGNKSSSPTVAPLLMSQQRLLNSFAEGMSSVLPVELLSSFTGSQVRDILCGNPEIDVELLHRVVEYEGFEEDDVVIQNFWEVLREMTSSERKLFLQFVWARNRLPLKESDFDAPFKIQKDTKLARVDDDYPLPSASTCFFSLTLPEYPDKDTLHKKLLFAIENVTTMESDYVTNDIEVGEGWRGL